MAARDAHDGRRVQAAAQVCPDGDVAHQLPLDRGFDRLAQSLGVYSLLGFLGIERQIPVRAGDDLTVLKQQDVPRREQANALKQRQIRQNILKR